MGVVYLVKQMKISIFHHSHTPIYFTLNWVFEGVDIDVDVCTLIISNTDWTSEKGKGNQLDPYDKWCVVPSLYFTFYATTCVGYRRDLNKNRYNRVIQDLKEDRDRKINAHSVTVTLNNIDSFVTQYLSVSLRQVQVTFTFSFSTVFHSECLIY